MLKLLISFCIVLLISTNPVISKDLWTAEELDSLAKNAENTVLKAYKYLWEYRLEKDLADSERDPNHTGVIGTEYTSITTTIGYEHAKVLSTRPGWAAWFVKDLGGRELWKKAPVAVSLSGSFPAINIALLAALQELQLNPKVISSIGASQWGANEPGLSWPEMEIHLYEAGILKIKSSMVTIGGSGDRGAEFDDYAMNIVQQIFERINKSNPQPVNLTDAVKKRMFHYGTANDYICLINVGGGHAAQGGGPTTRFNTGGWYFEPLSQRGNPDGVMDYFLKSGVPVLNIIGLDKLVLKYNIIEF